MNNHARKRSVTGIVVTHHPDLQVFERQWSALRPQVDHLVIVDNASSPAALARIRNLVADDSSTELEELTVNHGLAAAQNLGISRACAKGSNYVLLMDQDSIPHSGMVERLICTYEGADGLVAAVGPRIVDARTGGSLPYLKEINNRFTELANPDTDETLPIGVDQLISSGTLISTRVLNDEGGMREDLFIDAVDIEWCLRLRAAGYEILADGRAKLEHALGDKVSKIWLGRWRDVPVHSSERQYYIFRNMLLLCRSPFKRTSWRRYVFRILFWRGLIMTLTGPDRLKQLGAAAEGVLDAIFNRTGPRHQTYQLKRPFPNSADTN